MAGIRVTLNRRLRCKLQTLKRMKAKAIAAKVEMNRMREETTQMVAAMEEIKLEIDPLKASVHHHCDDMLLITGAVDNLSEIIFQL
ncbi:hypothetical protein SLEP1_g30955 [Rubroshorea leprosula]|uniref:Uncharacterized protein n=1 Tax=Rubroshorea leprosula TaxID=152421 RepID=A0AAV5K744_9ROSI|nr:hypothetical protein SLEP1_g30955 [Rubroshorea leprosula]